MGRVSFFMSGAGIGVWAWLVVRGCSLGGVFMVM